MRSKFIFLPSLKKNVGYFYIDYTHLISIKGNIFEFSLYEKHKIKIDFKFEPKYQQA